MTTDTTQVPGSPLPRDETALPVGLEADADAGVRAPSRRGRMARRFLAAFLAGLLAVMAIGAGALYAYDRQYAGRILPGIRVGSVELSGLSPDQARAALAAAYAGAADGQVVIHAPSGDVSVSYADIDRHVDVDQLVGDAMAIGQGGSPIERVIGNAKTALRGVTLQPRIVFDGSKLDARIDAVATEQEVAARNAGVKIVKTGFTIVSGENGKQADRATPFDEASAQLASLDAPNRIEVTVPVATVEPAITTAEANSARDAAVKITKDIVLTDGKDNWKIESARVRNWIRFSPTIYGGYTPVLRLTAINKSIKNLAKDVDRDPTSASFLVSKGNHVVGVTASHDGRRLDVDTTAGAVAAALEARAAGTVSSTVRAAVNVTRPRLTSDEAQKAAPLMKKISTWTTYFPISERNNFGANIWLPAKFIDGTVVAPGETFDFWRAVGPISRSRGFGLGGAIINGHTEPQGALAGGICSCSTTLFNAALRAGFQMEARRNHFYYIDRYPLGLDATVFISASGSTQTMSWVNDTKYPVLIRGIRYHVGSRGFVRFDLYSVPNHRKVVISAPTVRDVTHATTVVQYTSSLRKGVRQQIEFPADGKNVWRTVTVYENGRVIHRTTYYSHYSRITGIILVGTG
jgi:vancomycin resistance protein YoaR